MQAIDDSELLRQYGQSDSEEAFATLVSRYIDIVYSAAFRQVANHHQAEEITQAVFVILAQKARSLSPRTILAGWLFRTTQFTAANYMRAEIRRVRREQEASMQSNPSPDRGDIWQEVAPILDDAIAGLRQADRDAIVLRFLQGKDYKAVAAAFGGTEAAAQMRVVRALEKLRKFFAKRGVILTATALAGLMAAQGIQAAPRGLAASVTLSALQGTSLTASTLTLVKGTLKLMAWTKLRLSVGASVALLLVYQYHNNAVQAQRLTTAHEQLLAGKSAAAAQKSRVIELEQQTTAIMETRREQEQALARLRARRAANENQAKPAARVATTLLSALLADPVARESQREGLIGNARNRWEPLVRELKLKPERAEKLYQIAGDWGMRNIESVAGFTEGKITAEAAVQAGAQAGQNAADQVRVLLGEEGLAKWEACSRSFPARSLDEQFDRQLGFFGLKPEQRQALRDLIGAEPENVSESLVGDFTVRQLVYPDELDRRFVQEKAANQRILEKAGEFLEPNNVDALALMQAYNLAAQQRTALQILRRL